MAFKTRPIGVFDSGVGGLTVVRAIRDLFPGQEILYFGDTARVPYGNKSPETIVRYSLEVGTFLMEKGIAVLVVACNTSSSFALEALSEEISIPVMGMIRPGAEAAVSATRNGKIGLIGTRATVSSKAYERQILALRPDARVHSAACPLFVPLVEEGWASDPVAREVASRYLEPLLEEGIDTLILGCTHYPVLIPVLQDIVGPGTALVSSAEAAARALPALLGGSVMESSEEPGPLRVYVTDSGTHFQAIGEYILGFPIMELSKVCEERLVIHEK